MKILTWLAMISLTLLSSNPKLQNVLSAATTTGHEAAGLRRSAVMVTREMGHSNLLIVEARFMEEGKEQLVFKSESIFWPIKRGSSGGSTYWKKNLGKMCAFVLSKDEDTLEVIEAMPIWSKDPFVHIKRNVRVLTVQLEQPD